jgi:hypothetical protein
MSRAGCRPAGGSYKARALGDLRINGERLPANGFF